MEVMSEDGDDLVAIDDGSCVVDKETTIAITIVGDAKIKVMLGDGILQRFEMSGAAIVVNLSVVMSIGMNEGDFGAEFFEDGLADDGCGTVGAVDGDI